jgi:hypothetical protein
MARKGHNFGTNRTFIVEGYGPGTEAGYRQWKSADPYRHGLPSYTEAEVRKRRAALRSRTRSKRR